MKLEVYTRSLGKYRYKVTGRWEVFTVKEANFFPNVIVDLSIFQHGGSSLF